MMYCTSFACSMSIRTCEASQRLANEAIKSILEDEQSLFMLEDISISRMIVCGKCDRSSVDYGLSKKAFRVSISALVEKINNYEEWGFNPEETQKRRIVASREYRNTNAEEIKRKTKDRRLDQRITKIKEGLK